MKSMPSSRSNSVSYAKPEATFAFGTKAETLQLLESYELGARLCEQRVVTQAAWHSDPHNAVAEVLRAFPGRTLIVRSSSKLEDRHEASMAGAFTSVMGVACNASEVERAIEEVFRSYAYGARPDDQVLIQPMVERVAVSGVVFSADIATGAPYIVLNYDDFSGRTDTVTSGGQSKLIYLRRHGESSLRSLRFRRLIEEVYRIEKIAGEIPLDIEFCIDFDEVIYILQVRPLVVPGSNAGLDSDRFHGRLEDLERDIASMMASPSSVAGSRTIFGEMPDWNPAEIIGRTPTPLAASLYERLITDSVWSDARTKMGYRPVRQPLMVMLEGHPYIDVRLSLNSFLPADLSDDLAGRVIDEQLSYLEANVDAHDKVEFEVAITCWDFNLTARLDRLCAAGMTVEEVAAVEELIKGHTLSLISEWRGAVSAELNELKKLSAYLADTPSDPLKSVEGVLEFTKTAGTVPFAVLARHAFIAVALFKSLVANGALSLERYNAFLASVSAVTTDFVNDGAAFVAGDLSEAAYLERYGHLRPGTYDIRIKSYREAPEHYLPYGVAHPIKHAPFTFSDTERKAISEIMATHDFGIDADDLVEYARTVIAAREKAKFEFTRGLSLALDQLIEWGRAKGLSRDDLSFLRIEEVISDASTPALRKTISAARRRFEAARLIRLPAIIAQPSDCAVVRVPLGKPSFVSAKRVSGPVILLTNNVAGESVDGCIVAVESADPGYDWIFSYSILGLITKYGGANSHMAIRCAEFGLPAAIGCGDRTFEAAIAAGRVELDCAGDTIKYW